MILSDFLWALPSGIIVCPQGSSAFRNQIFIAKKVQFPAPEIFSDGFLHLQKHDQCAQGSLEISLHTYKINFGHLQPPLKFSIENWWISWKMMKIWKKLQILKSFIDKKIDFLPPKISQMMSYTPQKHNQYVQGSLETLLHTNKIHFGRLQALLRITIENAWILWKWWKSEKVFKFWKFSLLKKFNFLPPKFSQTALYTSKNITSVLREVWRYFYISTKLILDAYKLP